VALAIALLAAWWLWPPAAQQTPRREVPAPVVAVDSARRADVPPPTPVAPGREPESLATPFPARATASESSAQADALRVRILRPDGRPARLARVVLFDGVDAVVGEGDVDELGIWVDPGLDAPASLCVLGVTAGVERFELEHARGDHVLQLPDGETLHGRVLVDGAPPGKRFVVALLSKRLAEHSWSYWWQRPSAFWVDGEAELSVELGIPVGADGRFELSGLVAGEALEFRAPGAFAWDAAGSTPQPVTPPVGEMLIALRSPARLRGRVVDVEGRAITAASVELSVADTLGALDANGTVVRNVDHEPSPHGLPVDEHGRFQFPLADHAAARRPAWRLVARAFDVTVRAYDGRVARAAVRVSDLTRDHHLGDLVLRDDPAWVLDIVDMRGAWIPGAIVVPSVPTESATRRSASWSAAFAADLSGRVTLPASKAEAGSVTVDADGYLPRRFELPAEHSASPIEIALLDDTTLHVIVHGPWDDPVVEAGWSFRFELAGEDPIRFDPSLGMDATSELYMQRLLLRQAVDRQKVALRRMPRHGLKHPAGALQEASMRPDWHVDHLRPRHPLTLRVGLASVPYSQRPCPEAWIFEQDVTLEPGETREIHVDLSGWAAAR